MALKGQVLVYIAGKAQYSPDRILSGPSQLGRLNKTARLDMRRTAAMWMVLLAWLPVNAQTSKAVIEGVVINADTKVPVAGVRLVLAAKSAEGGSGPQEKRIFTSTDAAGRFVFDGLAADVFGLLVRSPGAIPIGAWLDLRIDPQPIPFNMDNGPGTTVGRSKDPDGTLRATVSINLSYWAAIDGKVTSPDGLPMAKCLIEMFREAPPGLSERERYWALRIPGTEKEVFRISELSLSTDEHGEYHAGRLEPGSYYVQGKCGGPLWKPGYWATFYPEATSITAAAPIRAAGGEHARADIRISAVKGFRIAGRLFNATPNTHVQAHSADEFTFRVFRGKMVGDQYSIENVVPGRYALTALIPGGDTGAGRRIKVIDRDLDGEDLTLTPFPDLPGTLTFPKGCTPSPVRVGLFMSDYPRVEATPDADDRFVLRHVPPVIFGVDGLYLGLERVRRGRTLIRLGDDAGGETIARYGPAADGDVLKIEMPCVDPARQP
jgi:hypothetical protein